MELGKSLYEFARIREGYVTYGLYCILIDGVSRDIPLGGAVPKIKAFYRKQVLNFRQSLVLQRERVAYRNSRYNVITM